MQKTIYIILVSFLLFITTGCTPIINKYRVTIDAITKPNSSIKPSSYTIKALGDQTDTDSLKFQQQSKHLVKLLNEKGYTESSNESLAEQIIYFDYGIEKIKDETLIYHEPDISFGISWGYPFGYYHQHYHPFWNDIEYTSYRTYSKTHRVFNRYIVILAKNQRNQEIWRVDVSSIGESDNLKKIVPLLIKASKPYIGTDTDKSVHLVIEEEREKKE
ncbi:hypothetical protein MNB_SV-12-1406 [hydrothermal vent metagenome]|uniref:DUF4136 domain-containing protein n=1 Tax=hydrothermal vent metagenome TaxID=652676 RepID=A0A1W1CPP7_9ZZZZ